MEPAVGESTIAICFALPIIALYIGTAVWGYNDAERRDKSGCLVALLILLLSWPVGLIIWLLIRPNGKF